MIYSGRNTKQTWRITPGSPDSSKLARESFNDVNRIGGQAGRNITPIGALAMTDATNRQSRDTRSPSMAIKKDQRIVETAAEARQGEPGPSVLAMLIASTGLAVVILIAIWFVFFRT